MLCLAAACGGVATVLCLEAGWGGVEAEAVLCLGWKLMSCGQCQELGQFAVLASDWLQKNEQPIRSRISSLTQLLTMTITHKFPPQAPTPSALPLPPQHWTGTTAAPADPSAQLKLLLNVQA